MNGPHFFANKHAHSENIANAFVSMYDNRVLLLNEQGDIFFIA